MSEPTKKVMWASTTPLTAPVGRNVGTPRKHIRVVHAPPLRVNRVRLAAVVLAVGAALEIGALFPTFGSAARQFPTYNLFDGPAVASSVAGILQQVVPVAPWILAAALVARGSAPWIRAGLGLAAGAVGLSASLALFPLAQVVHGGADPADSGAWLALAGALVAIVGVIMIARELWRSWNLGRLVRPEPARALFSLSAAAAVCVGSALGWLVYVEDVSGSNGVHQSSQLPGAFESPWPVITVEVILILVVAALAFTAVAWSGRAAAALALGLTVPLFGRVAAAWVRVHEGVTLRQAGLTPAAMTQYGITKSQVHLSVQTDKWLGVEIGGLVALALLAGYLLVRPQAESEPGVAPAHV